MLTIRTLGAAAFALCCAAGPSWAVSYQSVFEVSPVETEGYQHVIWLRDFLPDGAGPGTSENYWISSASDPLVFDTTGPGATLRGTIVSGVNSNYALEVYMDFTYVETGGRTPKCEYAASVCSSAAYAAANASYDYYNLDDGENTRPTGQHSLVGTGDLAGVVLSLSQIPADGHLPLQVGLGAAGKPSGSSDIDYVLSLLGASMWLDWDVTQWDVTGIWPENWSGRGDVNIYLTAVPLPAALPLFASALGGVYAIGRRRRKVVPAQDRALSPSGFA